MARWADRTLWVKQGDRVIQAVASNLTAPELQDILGCGDVALELTPATQTEPCSQCPLLDDCMDSVWNDSMRMSGPPYDKGKNLTFVHTCVICLEQSFTRLGAGEAASVPDGCHRWTPTQGSALPCNGCRNLDREADKAHPCHAARMEAAGTLMKSLLNGEKPAVDKLSRTLVPFSPEYEQDEHHLFRAATVIQRIVMDMTRRFPDLVPPRDEENTSIVYLTLLERVYLALLQHPDDPALVLRHFLLSFSRHRSCQLAALPVTDRKFAYRIWEGFIRAVS